MSWSPLDEKDTSKDAMIGDEPFDLVSECFPQSHTLGIGAATGGESPACVNSSRPCRRCLRHSFKTIHPICRKSAELASLTFKTRKIPERQKYANGDVLKATAANGEPIYARIFAIDPGLGPFVGVYDSLGMHAGEISMQLSSGLW